MKTANRLRLLACLMTLAGLSACATAPYDDDRRPASRPYYDDGYSAYDYYYYPGVAVYFQIRTGDYYYQDRGRWVRSRALPANIRLDREAYRRLVIRDTHPYDRHADHERLYGPPRNGRAQESGGQAPDREQERRPDERRQAAPARSDRDAGDRDYRGPERPYAGPPGANVAPAGNAAGHRDDARAPDRGDARPPQGDSADPRKRDKDKYRDGRNPNRQDDDARPDDRRGND